MRQTNVFAWGGAACFGLLPVLVPASAAVGENPWIRVLDRREIVTVYAGGPGDFRRLAESGAVRPMGLASADLDRDGHHDLIAAYAGSNEGWLALHRANPDSRDPHGRASRRHRLEGTFHDAPFLPEAQLVRLPVVPEFLGTGDLDGDGQVDAVVADGKDAALWWLPGLGSVDPEPPRRFALRGPVTALVTGDADRRDARDDVVVAIGREDRTEVVLVRTERNAAPIQRVLLVVPEPVSALAAGRLDSSKPLDLAVAAGPAVTVMLGDESGSFAGSLVERHPFEARVRSIAIGDVWRGDVRRPTLAVLLDDGTLHLIAGETHSGESLPSVDRAARIAALNLSNRPGQDLVFHGPTSQDLVVRVGGGPDPAWVVLDGSVAPTAVLPMQLNDDIFSDIVVQSEGAPAPGVLLTGPRGVFTVDSVADDGDAELADGLCETAAGDCTLRAAIEQGNVAAGTDAVGFNIPGSGPHTIQPLGPLPVIIDPLILDATTEPDFAGVPVVELDGSSAGEVDGLFVTAGSSTVKGLAVNRFGSTGVVVMGNEAVENRIQGCFIGTDLGGSQARGNLANGIFVAGGAQRNYIGTDGDGVADGEEGNLISGNGSHGVLIVDFETDGNVVAGNRVGTDSTGSADLGNAEFGVAVVNFPRFNRIGTDGNGVSDSDERNVISGNDVRGVLVAGEAEENVVAGNLVGTDAMGSAAVPNTGGGIEISNGASFNRVGTDADGQADESERNVVSGNATQGITMFGTPVVEGNVIAGNFIGVQADGASPLGNVGHGVVFTADAVSNLIGGLGVTPGACDGPCNRIANNGPGGSIDGVRIAAGVGNAVVGNVIHSNAGGSGIDIDEAAPSPNDPGDGDAGVNNLQNYPELLSALTAGGVTTLDGFLDSVPNSEFHLEFFSNATCDTSGYGEGEVLVATRRVTTDSAGSATFSVPVTPEVPAARWISATATRLEPGDVATDTSEFSPCMGIGEGVAAGRVPDGDETPGTPLTVAKGAVPAELVLSWGASCIAADSDYAVYVGDLGAFTSHTGRLCTTGGATTATFRTSATGIYILVVPMSGTREGSYGVDGDGFERPAALSACRPQSIGECD